MTRLISKLNKTVVISMGDPRGIGPEIIRKALKIGTVPLDLKSRGTVPIIVGDKKILGHLPPSVVVIDVAYKNPGEGALKFLQKSIEVIKEGRAQALVTAPLSKEAVSRYDKGFVGHTEYLARAFGVKKFDMMFVADKVVLSIVTRHVALRGVPPLITKKAVFEAIVLMAETLTRRFRIKNPKIAVLGLNPHAGEGGLLGKEEVAEILPAIQKARLLKMDADGPLAADTFFSFERFKAYDGIVAMYHDQGLGPLKALYMKGLVNFTAGLPFVRTSPAHGTAFDIAGKNKADPSSMIAAIKLACELS